jgi:hypothetical protein
MRGLIQLGILALAVGLGVGVGNRLSPEAMAVVVGVVCGVLAGVPMSVILMLFMRRMSDSGAPRQTQAQAPYPGAYPPVVVVQTDGAARPRQLAPPWEGPPAPAEGQPWRRSFTVVGDDDEW